MGSLCNVAGLGRLAWEQTATQWDFSAMYPSETQKLREGSRASTQTLAAARLAVPVLEKRVMPGIEPFISHSTACLWGRSSSERVALVAGMCGFR